MKSDGASERVGEKRLIVGIIGVALAIGLVVANTGLIYGLLSAAFPIHSTGVITSANFRVYRESGCINNVSSIDWGTIEPGGSKSVTVYVKNKGTVALSMSLTTANWTPSTAGTYIALSWDYSGVQIQPNQVLAVTFTVSVSPSIQGVTSFSFDINVIGTEVS